jgi:hypothetical protein
MNMFKQDCKRQMLNSVSSAARDTNATIDGIVGCGVFYAIRAKVFFKENQCEVSDSVSLPASRLLRIPPTYTCDS